MSSNMNSSMNSSMNSNNDSASRVFLLRPAIREHVEIYPQEYRGEKWYVVFDRSANQYLRFDARVYQVIGRLDGVLSLEEVFQFVNASEIEHPFSRDEFIELIGQLDSAELLSGGLPIDVDGSYKRHQDLKQKTKQRSIMNPLSIRIKLINPEKLLNFLAPLGHYLFSPIGFSIWLVTILLALLLGIANFSQLAGQISNIGLNSWQLGVIWVIYPVIKLFHELGHGLAIKKWGGNVREAGVNMLVFLPVPYVDATSSWAFKNKWKRVSVGAAGIMTELFLAALALFFWLLSEPGLFQEIMLNVMVIAVISTLLFNGNPLLRFDGYFVLEDYLEIPNLATRSKQYYLYLIQKYLIKLPDKFSPVTAHGERFWFILYGLASPLYRIFIMFAVAVYLATHYLFIGVMLAVWALLTQIIAPVAKGLTYLATAKEVSPKRNRALGLASLSFMLLIAVLLIPAPFVTSTQGVIAGQGDNQIIAKAAGFIDEVVVQPGQEVVKGQLIMRLRDDELQLKQKSLLQQRKKLLIELNKVRNKNRVEADDLRDDLRLLDLEQKEVAKQIESTFIYSKESGQLILRKPGYQLHGQYVRKGDSVGQVVNKQNLVVKAYIQQSRIGIVKEKLNEVEMVPASNLKLAFNSEIIHETPQASFFMPYKALTVQGGGDLSLQASENGAEMLKTPVFLLDLALPENGFKPVVGERVYVLLKHGHESLGYQLAWNIQQLFLKYLGQTEI